MSDIFAYVTAHWMEIAIAFTAFVYFFEKIAALTPSTWDDGVAGVLVKLVNWLALQKKA